VCVYVYVGVCVRVCLCVELYLNSLSTSSLSGV